LGDGDQVQEEIHHSGWRIHVIAHARGWKAFIYRPGAIFSEEMMPRGPERDAVIAQAKRYIELSGA